jgi:hypothetical protein
VDRYSFIATDSHRLLLAGLPAHSNFFSHQAVENPSWCAMGWLDASAV